MSPLIIGLLMILVYAPTLWVRYTLWRYKEDLADIPGTGGELAVHLIERFGLVDVTVEECNPGQDHYNPSEKIVRLSPDIYNGKSLTAIAVATHEVGHAIQFQRNDPTCLLYQKYYPWALKIQRIGIGLFSIPIFSVFMASPAISLLTILLAASVMLSSAVIHLIVLPQEWDASFNKAMPILKEGKYLDSAHLPKVHNILRAAALTYFASALADVLRCWRWGGLFRGLRF